MSSPDDEPPDTERMPSTLRGLGLLSTPPAPPAAFDGQYFFDTPRRDSPRTLPPPPPSRASLPTLPAPGSANENRLEDVDVDEGWPAWPDEERTTSLEVPRACPQVPLMASCRCGAPLGQLTGEDAGVWACSAVLLGVAPGGLHDERVRSFPGP